MDAFFPHAINQSKKINRPSYFHDGVLHAPPLPLSYSYPPPQQKPPLLPLPIISHHPINNNPRNRTLSCPPINRKVNRKVNNRARDQSFTPKKNCKPQINVKKVDLKRDLVMESVNPLGPDPNDLPKDVSRVLSPPPSSLPLPTFSLRPKLSCNAKAAGIDAGATDNLRRILRLR